MFKPNVNHTRGFTTFYHTRGQTSDSWKICSKNISGITSRMHRMTPTPNRTARGSCCNTYTTSRTERNRGIGSLLGPARREIRENPGNSPFFLWIDGFETTQSSIRRRHPSGATTLLGAARRISRRSTFSTQPSTPTCQPRHMRTSTVNSSITTTVIHC